MGLEFFKDKAVQVFLKRLFLFLLILFAADFAIGMLLKKLYFSQESGLEARTIYAVEKANEDLVILGSSRASHHYVPEVLEEELKLSSYNAGREGNFILYHNAVLQSMASRYQPRIVVLDILNKEFSVNQDSYDRLANLMPFYRSYPAIRPVIDLRGPFEPIKNLSFIYPYNSKLQAIVMGNLEMNKKRKQDFKGFIPLNRVMDREATISKDTADYPVDTLKVRSYRQLLETCKQKGIALYVICSPYYDQVLRADKSVRIAREIAEQYGVPFWDFSNDTNFLGKPEIFDDKNHLNEKGAKLYSRMIARRIAGAGNDSLAGTH